MGPTAFLLTGIVSIITATTTASPLPQTTSAPSAQVTQTPARGTLGQQLDEAVRAGNVEKTRALLAAGANPDGDALARNPVLDAVLNGNTAIVRLLAEAGANLDANDSPLPLQSAAEAGNVQMVRLLLSLGAKVNGQEPGGSALDSALTMQRKEIVKILIAAGADVDAEMNYAKRHNMDNIVRTLLEALGKVPPPIPAAQMVKSLEDQWSPGDLGWDDPQEWMIQRDADVEHTRQELAGRLKTHPQDRTTLMLWARLELAATARRSSKKNPPLLSIEEALNRVLAAHPHDAEALYYKGRFYGQQVKVSKSGARRRDVDKAVIFTRQAMKFAPDNLSYRETLAYFLADQGHPGEAKATLQAMRKDHPLIPLLEDLESLPIPAGAELFTLHEVSGLFMLRLSDFDIGDYPPLRLRTYRVSQSHAATEAFYQALWPGFHWIPDEDPDVVTNQGAAPAPAFYQQFLRGKPGAWKPSRDHDDLPAPKPKKDDQGILFILVETHNDPRLEQELGPRDVGRYLVLLDCRK